MGDGPVARRRPGVVALRPGMLIGACDDRPMQKGLIVLATALLLGTFAVTASTGWGPFQLKVPARGFAEHCVEMAAGRSMRYAFEAAAEVDFNIHYHRASEVFFPVKQSGVRSARGEFISPHDDMYCLMWEHKGEGDTSVTGSLDETPKRATR